MRMSMGLSNKIEKQTQAVEDAAHALRKALDASDAECILFGRNPKGKWMFQIEFAWQLKQLDRLIRKQRRSK
jgi:hypothetical protein